MAEQYTHVTKILDGAASLGRGNIIEGTLTVDGLPPPAEMVIDYEAGTVQWADQNDLGAPGPYTFVYEWQVPLADQKRVAKQTVKDTAEFKLAALDEVFTGSALLSDFMTQEVVQYQNEGRPADPNPAIYTLASELQTARNDATLRDTLEWMRSKYITLKASAQAIIRQRFIFLDQIDAAADETAIEAILANVVAW